MRISDSSGYFGCVQKVIDELKVGRNEMKGIDEVWLVVVVIFEMVYDGEVHNKNCKKGRCSKKVEEGIKHRHLRHITINPPDGI